MDVLRAGGERKAPREMERKQGSPRPCGAALLRFFVEGGNMDLVERWKWAYWMCLPPTQCAHAWHLHPVTFLSPMIGCMFESRGELASLRGAYQSGQIDWQQGCRGLMAL